MDAVNAPLQSFPQGGDEYFLLNAWLNCLSPAAQVWEAFVEAAHAKVQALDKKRFGPISENDMNAVKQMLWPLGVRETFSYLGMEPELLKTLFGDPAEYNVTVCPGHSLAHLLCCGKRIDILTKTCHLCMHSSFPNFWTTSDTSATAKITNDGHTGHSQNDYRSQQMSVAFTSFHHSLT